MKPRYAPDHVDLAVGEVDQLQHPVDQGVAEGDQGVAAADGDAIEKVLEEHGTPVQWFRENGASNRMV